MATTTVFYWLGLEATFFFGIQESVTSTQTSTNTNSWILDGSCLGQETFAFNQNFLKDGLLIACLEVSYPWDRLGEQYI